MILLVGMMVTAAASSRATLSGASRHNVREWHFRVLLDGKPIGEHDFVVTQQPADIEVETRAHFRVKALFVTAYRYDHQDQEIWRADCLVQMNADTDDNGRKLSVQGRLSGDSFEVHTLQGAKTLPACVRSFAYWDSSFLKSHSLLNAQTGQYEKVVVFDDGFETTHVDRRVVNAQHYSLRSAEFKIDLWYSPSGRWLALESHLKNGRTLRYELH
ncbi:MAG TPA: DUF6134 family protein [Steroidobacteraceae bacterium]|nr:DUF6134 family protein [Steroidobacteraceae bacterium]